MKKISLILLTVLSLGILSSNVIAEDEKKEVDTGIVGNFTIATDYIWRGLPQHSNKEGETIQQTTFSGGFDYDIGAGFSVGVWNSNVNWYNNANTNEEQIATIETDLYASYSGEFKNVGYEVGYINYDYPRAKESNFKEAYAKVSYEGFSLASYAQEGSNSVYEELAYENSLDNVDIGLSYSDYKMTDNLGKNIGHTVDTLTISREFKGLTFSASFIGKNTFTISGRENSFTVLSVGKSF